MSRIIEVKIRNGYDKKHFVRAWIKPSSFKRIKEIFSWTNNIGDGIEIVKVR